MGKSQFEVKQPGGETTVQTAVHGHTHDRANARELLFGMHIPISTDSCGNSIPISTDIHCGRKTNWTAIRIHVVM